MRRFYQTLIWLHPRAFRTEFGEEMLWIFEEHSGECGRVALLFDAAVSLARQTLFRIEHWKVPMSLAGAFFQVSIVMGSFAAAQPHIATGIAREQFRGDWTGMAQLDGRKVPLEIDFDADGNAWSAEAYLNGVPLRVAEVHAKPGSIRFRIDSGRDVVEFEAKRWPHGGHMSGVAQGHGTFTLARD